MDVFNYLYSIPYLIFLGYLTALMLLEFRFLKFEKDTKYIRWAVITGFVFFFGLRGFVYTDWKLYYPLFEKLPTIWDGGLTSILSTDFSEDFVTDVSVGQAGIELGFIYFAVFFKSIIPNYFAFVFFNSIIDVILLNVFFKRYSRYYTLSFILFIVFGGLILEFNLIRNIKAVLLFLISIKYLQERKIIPYMLLNLAGFFFHSSAIVFFPLYFILNKQWPQWLIWGIFIVGNIIYLLQIKYLGPALISVADLMGGRMGVKVRLYFSMDLYSRPYGIGIGYIERIITFFIFIIFQKKLKEENSNNIIFINAFLLYFIIYFFFAEIMVAIERLSLLFVFSYWIVYPKILELINKSINKLVFVLFILAYSVLKLVHANSNIFSKYDNLLFGIESFENRNLHIYNNIDDILGR
jgi:hypothetical protein